MHSLVFYQCVLSLSLLEASSQFEVALAFRLVRRCTANRSETIALASERGRS
jgi:hypothetical protein